MRRVSVRSGVTTERSTRAPARSTGEAERLFDLNIEEVLENWELQHAIREVIANALDEQVLSHTSPPEIARARKEWQVRDFGRGLEIRHFTQNENP